MADTNQMQGSSGEKKNNKAIIIIIVLLLIIVIGLVAVIAFLLGRKESATPQDDAASSEPTRQVQQASKLVLDEEDAVNIMEQMRQEVAEGMFECQMTTEWNFADGQSESPDAYVANSSNNTHPICFDVYIDNSDELLYSSPVLPVGTSIDHIKLDKELPAGSYQAICLYSLLRDVESQEVFSSAEFVITINVLH
jgi:hypothetical protein